MSVEVVKSAEVLEPGRRTLRELADEANREGELIIEAGASVVEHVITMGELLLAARAQVPEGSWLDWVDGNFQYGYSWAASSMRAARHQEQVRASGVSSFNGVKHALSALHVPPEPNGHNRVPEWFRSEAARLREEEGMSYNAISRELGVSSHSVRRWLVPGEAQKARAAARRHAKKRLAAQRALRERERGQAIRAAVRKAGGAEQELYAMAERMQDVMGQAHREATDSEKRKHYALAGEHYRKMRDEIVRALGVS